MLLALMITVCCSCSFYGSILLRMLMPILYAWYVYIDAGAASALVPSDVMLMLMFS